MIAAAIGLLLLSVSAVAGASPVTGSTAPGSAAGPGSGTPTRAPVHAATLDSYSPSSASFTGIDPGAGQFYSYAPSTVQTNSTTRDVFYCGSWPEGVVKDHVWLSVGHLVHGRWDYSRPKVVFGPENGPTSGNYFAVHTCEPEVIGGNFKFGGAPYRWAMLFTAEAVASNSTNVIGVAFANSLSGPWTPDSIPFVQTSDDFGENSYPNNCPVSRATGQTLYCLGEPAATTIGGGRVLLTYMGNAGSPGNDTNPVEGLVLRLVNLSNVPATGPCPSCFLALPDGKTEEAVTQSGLGTWPHDASIAYDPVRQRVVMTFDNGPYDTTVDGPPVTPVITAATIGINNLLRGTGSWVVQGSFGKCLSGFTFNHNSGIVRTSTGDLPTSGHLEVLYAIADDNLGSQWGVWDYRLWDVSAPLNDSSGGPSVTAASTSCPGLTAVSANGQVTAFGTARGLGSVPAPGPKAPVAAMALTPDRHGYFLVTTTGQVLTFGDAVNRGSLPPGKDGAPVIGIAVDPVTGGYWIARSDGTVVGVDAPAFGSFGLTTATGSVVSMAGIPNGAGYYLVTTDGDVGAFGHALSYGNLAVQAGQSVAAIATTPDGLGYYLVTRGGPIATFGDARLFGPAAVHMSGPVAAMAVSTDGFGYWLVATTGAVMAFGDASAKLTGTVPGPSPVVALAAS